MAENTFILYKLPFESSPHYDSWSLRSLSWDAAKKYFPEWGRVYTYQKDACGNDLYSIHTRDRKAVEKLAKKMTPRSKDSWEYVGHVRDLVDD